MLAGLSRWVTRSTPPDFCAQALDAAKSKIAPAVLASLCIGRLPGWQRVRASRQMCTGPSTSTMPKTRERQDGSENEVCVIAPKRLPRSTCVPCNTLPEFLEETIKLRQRRATFTGANHERGYARRERPAPLQGCQLLNTRRIDAGPTSSRRLHSRPGNDSVGRHKGVSRCPRPTSKRR